MTLVGGILIQSLDPGEEKNEDKGSTKNFHEQHNCVSVSVSVSLSPFGSLRREMQQCAETTRARCEVRNLNQLGGKTQGRVLAYSRTCPYKALKAYYVFFGDYK